MGATTVIADFGSGTPNNQIAARLVDVLPDGSERLVARGLCRPEPRHLAAGVPAAPERLHVPAGHVPRLELLPKDAGGTALNTYGRPPTARATSPSPTSRFACPVHREARRAGGAVKVPRDEFVARRPDPARRISRRSRTTATRRSPTGTLKATKNSVASRSARRAPGSPATPRSSLLGDADAGTAAAKGKGKGKKKKKKKKVRVAHGHRHRSPGARTARSDQP